VLPSQHRINRGEDFRRVLRSGVKSHSALGTVALAPTSGPFRVGVIVSKVVGNAVVRNRVKRMVRAAAKERADVLGGWDIVVRCSESAKDLGFSEILSFIDGALEKATLP
jgi:ribonuclease P protein component